MKRYARRAALILILVVVCGGWGYFLNFGDIPFDFHDWAEVNAPRLAFTKDALEKLQLPLHMPDTSALRGVTDRFMALPDVILSPQIILLRWMSVGTFVLVNTWLLIAIGYLGMIRLMKRFDLSLPTFIWAALLFYFNGHILSHYAVGHITWDGYFLLPWFVELVFRLVDGERGAKWEARMAFLLFAFFLQGSFHQFVWCVIFLGFAALSNRKWFWTILKAGIGAGMLSMVRIIPPAMQMGAFDDDFLGGYRTPLQILKAFVKIILPADALDQAKTGAVLGWWEFDIYTGIAGLSVLAAAALCWLILRDRKLGFPQLLCPIAVLSFFSVRNCYQVMRFFRIPLFSSERVSSRFLILPFVFILFIGLAALQRKLKRLKALNALFALALIPAAYELRQHLEAWKVTAAFDAFPYTHTDLAIKTVANHPDAPYTTGLAIGLAVTLLSAAVLVWRAKRQGTAEQCS